MLIWLTKEAKMSGALTEVWRHGRESGVDVVDVFRLGVERVVVDYMGGPQVSRCFLSDSFTSTYHPRC
jgi:hypothetical protein